MTKPTLHFALLVCDTPLPEVIEKYGDYTKQYPAIFEKASANANVNLVWDFFDVVDAQVYPSLQDISDKKYDAIVLTGSKYNAHDDTPWILKLIEFLQVVQNEPYIGLVKLVGICFGHQVILRSAGGVTERNAKGWERINQLHRDHVSVLPKGFVCLASTENTANHATVSENGQCITVQGHPEFNRDTMKIIIEKRTESGVLQKEQSAQWLNRLKSEGPEMEDVWLVEKFIEFIIL
ncbi:class I glutamine amidotransferase-like protein [Thamnidium elegans]|nr:class I glutamine amidotransferase-like protein [Thamnidium elegans]